MLAARKYLEVLAFVALWMAAGWLFHLSPDAYLLVGVPFVVLFQLLIRRQPLRYLWVREATSFRLGRIGLALAGILILVPGYELGVVALPKELWIVSLWLSCAVAGAVLAAFALQEQRASALRRGLPGFVAAIVIGVAIMAAGALTRHHSVGFPFSKLFFLLKQFLLYFTVSFVLEEVVFRGALDSHLYQRRDNGPATGSPWLSAIFVSALWGVWHLPTLSIPSPSQIVSASLFLIIIHTLVGVPLSLSWRDSGTLVLPATAHALIDAYRNIIL